MSVWRILKPIIYVGIFAGVILVFYSQRDFVNKNEGLVMASVTTILVATTIYYSLVNKRLFDATDSPKVILDIRPWNAKKQQYVFVIANVGTGIAFDITLEMLSNSPLMLDQNLSLANACAEIKSIPPKQDYKLVIETETWEPKDRQTSFEIKVSYTNSQKTNLPSEQFSLSIEASRHYLQGDLVAERLGEIADQIKEIADQSPNTNTTNVHEVQALQEQLEEQKRVAREQLEEQKRVAQALQEQLEEQKRAVREQLEE